MDTKWVLMDADKKEMTKEHVDVEKNGVVGFLQVRSICYV
jgi:hypothetical protein